MKSRGVNRQKNFLNLNGLIRTQDSVRRGEGGGCCEPDTASSDAKWGISWLGELSFPIVLHEISNNYRKYKCIFCSHIYIYIFLAILFFFYLEQPNDIASVELLR